MRRTLPGLYGETGTALPASRRQRHPSGRRLGCRPQWCSAHPHRTPTRLVAKFDRKVVLDLGANLRQHIIPAAELTKFLAEALNLIADPRTVHTLIIREFIQGDAGVLSHQAASGETVIEYAAQGLLAMNRGLADP